MAQRLQKVIANAGLASRREAERWIQEGRVTVDGEAAQLGQQVEDDARICIDGREIAARDHSPRAHRHIMYHKPAGEICSRRDEHGRPSVFAALPRLRSGRWISVGRLDFNTSGLLLFTTDGELANRLMHPSSGLTRRYVVRVHGEPDDAVLDRLREGVELEDGPARFDSLVSLGRGRSNSWFEACLTEGRNREVRRLWEAVGFFEVSRLSRAAFGPLTLPRNLARGKWRDLTESEVSKLIQNQ